MATQLTAPDYVETPPSYSQSRISRLQSLVCTGAWGGDNNLVLISWVADTTKIGGGYWVAWDAPNPFLAANVTIS